MIRFIRYGALTSLIFNDNVTAITAVPLSHSERGIKYASSQFRTRISDLGMRANIGRPGSRTTTLPPRASGRG